MPATERILAIIALSSDQLLAGGAPIFLASSPEEREKIATYLSRILSAQVHDLENGIYIVVKH